MFYDLIHISCLTSSKEASLKAAKLSQSKMCYPNLWGWPVYTCSFLDCLGNFIFTQNLVIHLNSQQLDLSVVNYTGSQNWYEFLLDSFAESTIWAYNWTISYLLPDSQKSITLKVLESIVTRSLIISECSRTLYIRSHKRRRRGIK